VRQRDRAQQIGDASLARYVAAVVEGYVRIIGHGVDIVEVSEVEQLADAPGNHFLSRCFAANEIREAGTGPNRRERLAGRFAAKEAIAKAMGVGAGHGFAWSDIEITTADSGAPGVTLRAGAAERADSLGITSWLVSTSHTDSYAVASAIALG
jgi:holo-[acyl-carrier protein] synthase